MRRFDIMAKLAILAMGRGKTCSFSTGKHLCYLGIEVDAGSEMVVKIGI
jgi:hypothetical protein